MIINNIRGAGESILNMLNRPQLTKQHALLLKID